MLPYIAEMPKPYVFDIERINKELKENSKVIEGIKDYIANKCDTAADTEHSLSGTPTKAVHPENYSSFEDGTYNWFPVSVFDKKNKTEFDTFKNLEKEPEFDERRYTRISSWAKGTYIEEVLKVFKNQVTKVKKGVWENQFKKQFYDFHFPEIDHLQKTWIPTWSYFKQLTIERTRGIYMQSGEELDVYAQRTRLTLPLDQVYNGYSGHLEMAWVKDLDTYEGFV